MGPLTDSLTQPSAEPFIKVLLEVGFWIHSEVLIICPFAWQDKLSFEIRAQSPAAGCWVSAGWYRSPAGWGSAGAEPPAAPSGDRRPPGSETTSTAKPPGLQPPALSGGEKCHDEVPHRMYLGLQIIFQRAHRRLTENVKRQCRESSTWVRLCG